jgi:hypothetical protein
MLRADRVAHCEHSRAKHKAGSTGLSGVANQQLSRRLWAVDRVIRSRLGLLSSIGLR